MIRAGLAARGAEPSVVYRVDSVPLGAPRADTSKALQLAALLEDDEQARKLHLRK